jgi:Ca-activated chloride channel family protein
VLYPLFMRAAVALLLALCSLGAFAEELAFDFTVEVASAKRDLRQGAVIPVALSIPVDQLRFVEDGREQAARFTIRTVVGGVTTVVKESHRITAPLATLPQGVVTYRFEVAAARGVTAVTVIVHDEQSGATGTRTVSLEETPRAGTADRGPAADAAWAELRGRAEREKKPLVVFFRTTPCARCAELERVSVPHPAIARRLPSVVFGVLPAEAGQAARSWQSERPGVALFDRSGVLRARWPVVPDTTNFGIILDSIIAVAPHFERAVELTEAGAPDQAQLAAAIGLARLGRTSDARAAIEAVREHGNPNARQAAIEAAAALDAQALNVSRRVDANAAGRPAVIRILPLGRQVVSGRQTVKTHVASVSVARVTFSVDGHEAGSVEQPPFSTKIDFGQVPQRHAVSAIAFGGDGAELGRDERIVNDAGEAFWIRLITPRDGPAGGAVRVSMNVRVPAARGMRRVVLSWNDAQRAVLTSAPWQTSIDIPEGQAGVLRAVAELDDGRTVEDAVLLNAGMVGNVDVQLAELPMTITSRTGEVPQLTPERITVREGGKVRRVDAISTAAETPLTVGLLIDVSDSMQKTLPDVQEAAIRFLETILGERDRAFLITFDSGARLLQPATGDVALLRRRIMSIRPNGLTALHDAMVLGLLQFEGIKGRRAVVVFSDGIDRTSAYAAADVGELARRVNVPVHVIAAEPGMKGMGILRPEEAELTRIAQTTGGTYQKLHELAELPGLYARIQAALRSQFLVFVRTEPATRDNEWRPVQITVDGEPVEVYAPEGYYAVW